MTAASFAHVSTAETVNPPQPGDPTYSDYVQRRDAHLEELQREMAAIAKPELDLSKTREPRLEPGFQHLDDDGQRRLAERATLGYEFRAEHGIFTTDWPDPAYARVDFDLLRTERSGDLTGEATVRMTGPGAGRHVHTARMTLTGTRSRAEVAKQCHARARELTAEDWDGIIEVACVRTIEAFRTGEPAILMRDAVQPMADGQLVPPFAHAMLPEIVFGDGGTGKSELALALGASIQSGQAYLGLDVTGTRTVGYLDWEMTAWEHRQRLAALCGPDMPAIVYIPCVGPLREQVDRLRRIARGRGIGYWIVDSIAPACGGEPEAAEVALGYFMALRSLGGGSLSVAHVKKEGKDADYKPFGSSFWHNMARSTWYAKKQQETNSPTLTLGLYHRKSNLGPLRSPLAFEITFGDGETTISKTSIASAPDLAAELPLRLRMAQLLRTGALSYADIAAALNVKLETVSKTASRYEGHLFTKLTDGGSVRIGLLEERIA